MSRLRKWCVDFLTRKIVHTITEEDILQVKGNTVSFRGSELTKEQLQKLKQDADIYEQSDIYILIQNEIQYLAQKAIYEDSTTMDDVVAGKLLLYLNDLHRRTLIKIKSL